jgi:hypothetical protein
VDDFDHGLRRRQRRENVGADRLLFDGVDELFGDGEINVGLEKRDPHFSGDVVHVRLRKAAAAPKTLEDRAEAFA